MNFIPIERKSSFRIYFLLLKINIRHSFSVDKQHLLLMKDENHLKQLKIDLLSQFSFKIDEIHP
jgi:hypothetical protein